MSYTHIHHPGQKPRTKPTPDAVAMLPHCEHHIVERLLGENYWNPGRAAEILAVRHHERLPHVVHPVPFHYRTVEGDKVLMPSFGHTVETLRQLANKHRVGITFQTSVANAELLNSQKTSTCWQLIHTTPTSRPHRKDFDERGCAWCTPTIADALQYALLAIILRSNATKTLSYPAYFFPPKQAEDPSKPKQARPPFYLKAEGNKITVMDEAHYNAGAERTLQCIRPPAAWINLLATAA